MTGCIVGDGGSRPLDSRDADVSVVLRASEVGESKEKLFDDFRRPLSKAVVTLGYKREFALVEYETTEPDEVD